MDKKQESSRLRTIKNILAFGIVFIVFAYGFEVTQIDLEEPKKENRQAQLANVIRALAHPDLFEYATERIEINVPIYIPCPKGPYTLPDLSQPGPTVTLSEECAEPESEISISGTGFEQGDDVLLFFVPYKEDVSDEVQLPLVDGPVRVDNKGEFLTRAQLKKGRVSENPQQIRAVVLRRSGLPMPSESVFDTFDKIIETIFLALIATTLGVIIAVPISFLAARNLMKNVTTAFGSLVTVIAVAPAGWYLGAWLFGTLGGWGVDLLVGGRVPAATALWAPAILLLSVQAVSSGNRSGQMARLRGYGMAILGAVVAALVLGLVAGLGLRVSATLSSVMGPFAFLSDFIYVLSDSLALFLPAIGGLAGMFAFMSVASVLSDNLLRKTGNSIGGKIFTVIMAFFAGMVIFAVPAAIIAWLYQSTDMVKSVGLPALIGGLVFVVLALGKKVDTPVSTGMILYYFTRTILNVQRAIEPLIMAIVFVVWVGIGPFAGMLALTLHTVAALGKLYSEQVESIAQGPIEAVTATGANSLQTIIYAVVPQIVPPYIAFTIYRWDINVRMSTIIGFAGGGGIGFLLQQNLNLLKYRQAAVQMIAIAIVVASLDYVSARIRERII